jgi:hypothetical protein
VTLAGIAPLVLALAAILVWHAEAWTNKYELLATRLAPLTLLLYLVGCHIFMGVQVATGATA